MLLNPQRILLLSLVLEKQIRSNSSGLASGTSKGKVGLIPKKVEDIKKKDVNEVARKTNLR
jgi:hypothetical protein